MTNLREAVARALYEHREGPVANADFSRQQALWHDCLLQADAALAAIDVAEAGDQARAERDALREALMTFRNYGCPICYSDCADANPPAFACPMKMARAALEPKP